MYGLGLSPPPRASRVNPHPRVFDVAFGERGPSKKEEEEEENVFKAAMNEVDAGRDRATPEKE